MERVGIFYGSSSGKTESAAVKMHDILGNQGLNSRCAAELHDIADTPPDEILNYDLLIFGVPTWGIGELQEDWMLFFEGIREMELKGRRIALFGLGDQESYPETFCDALGELYAKLEALGCELTGSWPAGDYAFLDSKALRDGEFVGLILDAENQPDLTGGRIEAWLHSINLV